MIDRFRTRLATLIVTHLTRPTMLVIQCWLWLAAETYDLEEKRRCLNMVLYLDPDNEPASLALQDLAPPAITPEVIRALSGSLFANEFDECLDAAQTIICLAPLLTLEDEMVAHLVCVLVKVLSAPTPDPDDQVRYFPPHTGPYGELDFRDVRTTVFHAIVGPDVSFEDAILQVLSQSPASAKESAALVLLRGHLPTDDARPVLHSALEHTTDQRLALVLRFALAILFRENPGSVYRDLVQYRISRPPETDSFDDWYVETYLRDLDRYVSADTAARSFCQLAAEGFADTALGLLSDPVLFSVARSCSHDAWVRMTETAWSQFLLTTNQTHLAHLAPIHNPSQVRLVLEEHPPPSHYLPNLPQARGRLRLTHTLWGPVLTVLMDARIPRE